MNAQQLLAANHIALADLTPGRHYTTCPQCSAQRSTREHRTQKCLGVTIDADDKVRWGCSHCSWTGPEKGAAKGNGAARPEPPTYEYRSADGVTRFRKVRLPPKVFWLERPDSKGGWIKNTEGVDTSLLYHADEVVKAIAAGLVICVAEGEKDCDTLRRAGFVATCNAHGASDPTKRQKPKWTAAHSAQLAGAEIVVLNDNDPPGYAHAETTCRLSLGVASRVRRLDLKPHWPDIPKGGDVSDWLAAGASVDALKALIAAAPDYEPPTKAKVESASPGPTTPEAEANGKGQVKRGNGAAAAPTEPLMKPIKRPFCANVGNAITLLETEPALQSMLAYDEMSGLQIVLHAAPKPGEERPPAAPFTPRPLLDEDVVAVQHWLQWKALRGLGRVAAYDAILKRARDCSFHPVRDYLDALQWDGKERLPFWLSDYLDAPDDAYARAIGPMFLIAMAARILRPGCKADYMLVLEGPQGLLKSQACAVLGGPWFSSSLPDITNVKDAMQHLRGKWLIEIAELHAIGRAETTLLKSFISREVGRSEVVQPRQCLFIGSTNEQGYLRDQTGNRRFWPVKCSAPDVDALSRDRDQLFAEAVVRFRRGEHWWPDPAFEKATIAPEQELRRDTDAWEPKIADWLEATTDQKVLIWEVAAKALSIEVARLGRADQNRIVAALIRAGWERARATGKGKWWERSTELAWNSDQVTDVLTYVRKK